MYHYLSEPPAGADIYRRDLSVTPSLFAQHLDRLLAEGYTTLRLDDLLLHLTQGTPLPPKPKRRSIRPPPSPLIRWRS
jgi:hypothetical protein